MTEVQRAILKLKRAGWRNADIARALNVSPLAVINWAKGRRPQNPDIALKVLRELASDLPPEMVKSRERERTMAKVSEQVRRLKERGWPVQPLATELGISRETLYRYMAGKRVPSPVVRRALDNLMTKPPPKSREEVMVGALKLAATNNLVEASRQRLSELSGYSPRQVDVILAVLLENRRIVRLSSHANQPNRYQLLAVV